jgi:hypothetical protein
LSAGEPAAAPATADTGADVALILDALGRMETTIREERATLGRLRQALGEMARAVARAKAGWPEPMAIADSNAATLLDELEHHIDTMLEIAGGGSAPVQIAEPDQVPTVSGVVSQLAPLADTQHHDAPQGSDAGRAGAPNDDTRADASGEDAQDVPTVSMLKAMVEALNAAAPSETPEAHAKMEAARSGESDVGEANPVAAPQTAPAEPSESTPDQPQAENAPRDPLAPLRAMSEDERIALFS